MEKVLATLDEGHQKLLTLVTPMSEENFSGRIVPEMWSIAENIHHLYIVESGCVQQMKKSLENPRTMSAIRRLFQVPGWMAGIRLIKVKAPKFAEPLNPPSKAETLENFKKTREELKKLCQQVGSSTMQTITIKHPVFGDMDGLNFVVFLGAHEVRHYKQIVETIGKSR